MMATKLDATYVKRSTQSQQKEAPIHARKHVTSTCAIRALIPNSNSKWWCNQACSKCRCSSSLACTPSSSPCRCSSQWWASNRLCSSPCRCSSIPACTPNSNSKWWCSQACSKCRCSSSQWCIRTSKCSNKWWCNRTCNSNKLFLLCNNKILSCLQSPNKEVAICELAG